MKKQSLILFFGYMCNNRCIFCDSDMRDPVQLKREKAGNNFSAVRIKKIISRLGKKGYSGIEFAGGEPTCREDIFELVNFAKKSGFKFAHTTTNARKLSDPDYAKEASQAFDSICVSVLGHNPLLHDHHSMVKGSFKETVKGLKNYLYLKKRASVNIIITKKNHRHLADMAEFVSKFDISGVKLLFAYPLLRALDDPYNIIPCYGDALSDIEAAIGYLYDRGIPIDVENIPLCLLNKDIRMKIRSARDSVSVISQADYYFNALHSVAGWVGEQRSKLPGCEFCKQDSECFGPTKGYLRLFGIKEFKNAKV